MRIKPTSNDDFLAAVALTEEVLVKLKHEEGLCSAEQEHGLIRLLKYCCDFTLLTAIDVFVEACRRVSIKREITRWAERWQ